MALPVAAFAPASAPALPSPVSITGELTQWQKVTLTVDGPYARERDTEANPFLDDRFTVRFAHESGDLVHEVPGYSADNRIRAFAEELRERKKHRQVILVSAPRRAPGPGRTGGYAPVLICSDCPD